MEEKGMRKKINIFIVAAVVAVIAVIMAILAFAGKKETYRSIKIIELEGGVTIHREGIGILEASNNMNLISGDSIQTEQGAYAVLQLDSDKYVMLAESGRMTVVAEGDEANSKTAIHLEAGSVLNEIQNPLSSGSSYDVVTPNATMSVRGTVFEVRKNSDNIEVLVYDGTVAVGLDGKEPALYEAGEYTQFTDEEEPRFIIERTEITEDVLNDQVLERLEQIDSQSRELDLGAAQLASAQTQNSSAQTTPVPEATAKPVPTVQPTPSVTPSPSAVPAATPTPAKTPQPQISNAGTVQATPEAVSPEPEEEEPDDDDWDWDWDDRWNNNWNNDGNNGNNGNNHDSGNKPQDSVDYTNFWQTYTMAKYKEECDKPAAETECTVIYYLPYIAEAKEQSEDSGSVSALKEDSPKVYNFVKVTKGSSLARPDDPKGYINYENDKPLEFFGWCLEDGTMWNFDDDLVKVDTVKADTCLYPVWKEKDEEGQEGQESTYYYPVFARSNSKEVWGYYCNNVKEGSLLKAIELQGVNDAEAIVWKNVNDSTDDNMEKWDFESDEVKSALSLEAVWNSTSE